MRRWLIILILFLASVAQAQQIEPGLVGTDFWLTFLNNGNSSSVNTYTIFIASEYDCSAHVEAPLLGWDTTVFVPADTTVRVIVPDSCTPPYGGFGTFSSGLHVVTSTHALVYASNQHSQSSDMTSILPTSVLRNSYMTQTYGNGPSGSQVAVVAPYDSTQLRVVFAEAVYTGGNYWSPTYNVGDTVDLILMRGMVYMMNAGNVYSDFLPKPGFSGTRFTSSKPVAVFQGHRCTNVPDNSSPCDHLYEQTLPSDLLGCQYVIVPTSGRVPNASVYYYHDWVGDFVKVTARDDNCTVFVDNQPVAQLNAGKSYEFILTNHTPDHYPSGIDLYQYDALLLSTSSPAMVCFYISSSGYGGRPGDPAVVVVPPVEQGISRTIAPVYNSEMVTSHYVNVVTPTPDVGAITLDGANIASSFTQSVGGYSYARLTIGEGVHILDADTGRFLATFYGLGWDDSYAYIAGMAARSAVYNVYANTHSPCLYDTVTIVFSTPDSTLGVEWYVDGQVLNNSSDTLKISFDSTGLHCLAVVVVPTGDTIWEYITVVPPHIIVETDTILQGQAYDWHGFSLTESGIYFDTLVTANGCDSVFVLNLLVLGNGPLQITSEDFSGGICLGDTVHLTATPDNALCHWTSTPYDPALDTQSNLHTIAVSPTVTTTYSLLENLPDGPAVTILVSEPGELCLEVNTPTIFDFDDYYVSIDNCSSDATLSRWSLEDGREFDGFDLRCRLQDNVADSFAVTMHTCWEYCCLDTTLMLPVVVFSCRFPNVITPNGDGINDFFVIEELNTDMAAGYNNNILDNRLQVFDRWGKKVYDVSNYDSYARNGIVFRGEKYFDASNLSDGVYYFLFQCIGKLRTITFNGSITVIR